MSPISLPADAIRTVGGLLVAGVLAYGAWTAYGWAYDNGYNAANVRAEQVIAEFRKAEAEAQLAARKAERDKQAVVDNLAAEYERRKADAEAKQATVVADLRAGNLKLRAEWRGCETDRLSAGAESARLNAEADQRRAEAAARIVRVGDECDAFQRSVWQYAKEVAN